MRPIGAIFKIVAIAVASISTAEPMPTQRNKWDFLQSLAKKLFELSHSHMEEAKLLGLPMNLLL